MRFNTLATLPALLILSGFLAGCARFTPLPLPDQTEVLKPPDMARVRVAANGIRPPLLPPIHFDDRDGISPDEAALLAVLLNPKLRAARDERGIAGAQLLQAGLLPNPSVGASWETPNGGDATGTVDGYGVGLDWDVRRLLTRAARNSQAAAHAEAVDLGIAWREWQTAEAAKQAVWRLDVARHRTDIARAMVEKLHAQTLLIEQAVGQGRKTRLDAGAAETAEAEARTDFVGAKRNAVAARLALNRLLGLPSETRLRIAVAQPLPVRLDILPRPKLLEDLENRRPDLLALRRGYESRNARLRAAVLEQFPNVRIGLTQSKGTDAVKSFAARVSVELPIFDRGRIRVEIEKATRKKLRDEYAARVFDAVSRVDELLAGIETLQERIAAVSAALEDLDKLRNACTDAVRHGRMDLLRATAVSARFYRRKLETIALQRQLIEARIALELLTGRYRVTRAAGSAGNRSDRSNRFDPPIPAQQRIAP